MERVRAWSGRDEAQTLATVETEVTTLKKRLANYEEALKQKVESLMEAEKGQVELRKALADKEAELAAARKEVAQERRRSADTDHLRGKLRIAQSDIKSLQRRHGILRTDLEEAHSKEKCWPANVNSSIMPAYLRILKPPILRQNCKYREP
jgi:chromosome segregation ATPase